MGEGRGKGMEGQEEREGGGKRRRGREKRGKGMKILATGLATDIS